MVLELCRRLTLHRAKGRDARQPIKVSGTRDNWFSAVVDPTFK
jgi:hypothetical protein